VTLQTQRLILRKFTNHDLEALASILADKEVMRFSISGPLSKDEVEKFLLERILAHYDKYGFGLYAVIHKEDLKFIGFVGLITQNIDGEEKVELAYRLDLKYWRKGLATEAAMAVSHFAFNQLEISQLISIIDPKNIRSLKVAERLGMHFWKESFFHGISVRIYALNKLIVKSFQENWSEAFLSEMEKLSEVFKGLKIDFYHIGSTSISGCSAKPIIDILGVTSDVLLIDKYNAFITNAGYEVMGEYGMKQRRFFRKKQGIAVNLHIFEDSDPEVERHLRFRNYLRAHPERTRQYSQLKETLAKQFPGGIVQYTLGKEKFIKEIDVLAAQNASACLVEKSQKKKKDWSFEEILKAMEVNMHLQMTYFAKYIPDIKLIFEPDVTIICSEINDDTFNYVLSARFTETNVKERILYVSELYRRMQLPFSWWTGPFDTPDNLCDVLISLGFHLKEENIGMNKKLDDLVPSSKKHELHFVRVTSPLQLKNFSDVVVSAGMHLYAYEKIYSKLPPILYQEGAGFEMHIAYLNSIPVVTGILVLHANVAGIYYIITVPDQRKRGHGTAMMEYLLSKAKSKGYHMATLQASKNRKNLYEQLGFKECCIFKEYALPAS
jgi:RimJ/RimL family protein N-acetyltransferase/GNAT superfamily N-acetyltransferase